MHMLRQNPKLRKGADQLHRSKVHNHKRFNNQRTRRFHVKQQSGLHIRIRLFHQNARPQLQIPQKTQPVGTNFKRGELKLYFPSAVLAILMFGLSSIYVCYVIRVVFDRVSRFSKLKTGTQF